MSRRYQLISVLNLTRGRYQPRKFFEQKALEELGQSILTQGLIEPLVVRATPEGPYEIIAGERRWRAAIMVGLNELPCVIGDYNNEQAAAITLIENIQREALNLIEEANGYRRLIDEFYFTQEDVSDLVGKSRSHVANILRLLSLDESVKVMVQEGVLTLGHARMLVGLDIAMQRNLARLVQAKSWSVRKLEQAVKASREVALEASNLSPDIRRLQETLALQVGAPVEFDQEGVKGGWLKIKYFDNDTLAGLLERFGLRYD